MPQAMQVFQRIPWTGTPQEEATWWTPQREGQSAVCRMFSHPAGHELRLEISGETVLAEVCGKDDEVLACEERWRVGLEEKRWAR